MRLWRKGVLALAFMGAVFGAVANPSAAAPQTLSQPTAVVQTIAATPRAPVQQTGSPAYYVQVKLHQSHFSLDIGQHLKDSWDAVTINLPASKAMYDKMHSGEDLVDKFRSASFWVDGTWGHTKMTVENMPAVRADADGSAYNVKFRLYQSNFTLDPFQHIKNNSNAVEFNWQVPGNVYNDMKVGDDLVQNGFRAGSFFIQGRVGKWHLQVLEKNGPVPGQQQAPATVKPATPSR